MVLRERRAAPRYLLDVPIIVRRENDVLGVKIRNISTGGIYFITNRSLKVDEVVDFSLTFAGLAAGADILVRGRARVLRVVRRPQIVPERLGVAATIENFDILKPEQI